MQLVRGGFSEKFEKLRHRPRPGLEPSTERKSKIILLQNAPHELHRHRVEDVSYKLFLINHTACNCYPDGTLIGK